MGGVIDANVAQRMRCRIVCGGANNVLDDPDEDAVALKNAGILYAPDFVVNAGGLISLAGQYLRMSERELEAKNREIEVTTAQVLRGSESMPSTHAAAIAWARARIEEGTQTRSEQVYAG